MTIKTTVLADKLCFTESPRWRDGKLWFSDFYGYKVYTVDLNARLEEVVEVPAQPSGLGWLPNGDLLVVSMQDKKILRYDGKSLSSHADISAYAKGFANDILVTNEGNAYVGNFGFDLDSEPQAKTQLVKLDIYGNVNVVAEDLNFPNGMVLADEGKTLIVAETLGMCLTAFTIDQAGNLSNRRTWADLGEYTPDGICIDKDGAIWVATALGRCLIRVEEGGNITHQIPLTLNVFACALAGDNEELLFICSSENFEPDSCQKNPQARIELIHLHDLETTEIKN